MYSLTAKSIAGNWKMAVDCLHNATLFFAGLWISLWVRKEKKKLNRNFHKNWQLFYLLMMEIFDSAISELTMEWSLNLFAFVQCNFLQLKLSLVIALQINVEFNFSPRPRDSWGELTCCRWRRSVVPSWRCSLVARVLRRCLKTKWWLPGRHRLSRCGGTWIEFHFRRCDEPIAIRRFELPKSHRKNCWNSQNTQS